MIKKNLKPAVCKECNEIIGNPEQHFKWHENSKKNTIKVLAYFPKTEIVGEIDFDDLFSAEHFKNKIRDEIDQQIRNTIASEIQRKLMLKIKEASPILDERLTEIVQDILYKINSQLKLNE